MKAIKIPTFDCLTMSEAIKKIDNALSVMIVENCIPCFEIKFPQFSATIELIYENDEEIPDPIVIHRFDRLPNGEYIRHFNVPGNPDYHLKIEYNAAMQIDFGRHCLAIMTVMALITYHTTGTFHYNQYYVDAMILNWLNTMDQAQGTDVDALMAYLQGIDMPLVTLRKTTTLITDLAGEVVEKRHIIANYVTENALRALTTERERLDALMPYHDHPTKLGILALLNYYSEQIATIPLKKSVVIPSV